MYVHVYVHVCMYMSIYIYIYNEYVSDDSVILDIWTSDSNLWRVNEYYISETREYIWYVTTVHNVFYISKVTLK